MARAKAKKWLGVVAGLALPAAGVGVAGGGQAARAAGRAVCQALPSPSRTSAALNGAIDSYRKGDYEAAADGFSQAQAGRDGLTPQQQLDLATFIKQNTTALQGRREAADQVRLAEQAEREGRGPAAADLAGKALANQYVAPADRQKAQAMLGRLRGVPAAQAAATGNPVVAEGQLAQARRLLAEGNYDAAEQLAREAERAGYVAAPGEESPKKLLEEVGRARQDPGALLTAARAACARGDYDRAEALARASEKAEPAWQVHLWGDSPSKVLKDVQAARAAKDRGNKPAEKPSALATEQAAPKESGSVMGSVKGMFTGKKDDGAPAPSDPARAQQARQLVQEGRKALKDGQTDKAEELARKADALKANLAWWEDDNPGKLLADVREAKAARAASAAAKPAAAKEAPADPKALLKQAHEAFAAGKLDEATALAQRAKLVPGASWGLFDFDTPDKLINEVNKARTKRNQDEAAKLLADGRQLLARGDLDGAQKAALRAERLRAGTSGMMDWGDRPAKLLDDVAAARQKARPKAGPPEPPPVGSAVTNTDGSGRAVAAPPDDPQVRLARQIMNDAREAARAGNMPRAMAAISSVEEMHVPADRLGSDSPAAVRRELTALASGGTPANGAAPAGGKERARQLVAEARQLQGQGRLAEARARLLEAQKLNAPFGLDEDRPEKALLDLAGLARRQMDRLISDADEAVRRGAAEPPEYAKAEASLAQAQALARGFQLDTYLIDKKLAWVQQTRLALARGSQGNGIQRVTVTDGGPKNDGQRLLDDARREVRAGNTGAARRLVDQVYAGPYGLKADAENLLRSIDVEEHEQKRREAHRVVEAANGAFRTRDYQVASQMLRAIDPGLLDERDRTRMRELMSLPEMQPANFPDAVARNDAAGPGATVNPNDGAGHSRATDDSREGPLLKQVEGMNDVRFQKLRALALDAEKEARDSAQNGDTEHALEVLQRYLGLLPDSGLDADKTALLRRPVEARLQQYRTLNAQNQLKVATDSARGSVQSRHEKKELAEVEKQKRIKELMEQYNDLYKKAKYSEAEMCALQARDLDPDNAVVTAAITIAQRQYSINKYKNLKENNEKAFLEYADDANDLGRTVSLEHPINGQDKTNKKITDGRYEKWGRGLGPIGGIKSEKEREIERRMGELVNMNFSNVPLGTAIDELATMHQMNIVPDTNALQDQGVSLDHPLTIRLDNIALRSALKLLLSQVRLTYVVEDDVLKITTPERARGNLLMRPYQVAELIIPLADGTQPPPPINTVIGRQNQAQAQLPPGGPSPAPGNNSMFGGTSVGSPGGSAFAAAGGAAGGGGWGKPGGNATREDQLIQLIQNTVAPKSWAAMGGPGTIDYFPMTMTLVINQTQDIQEQIRDLLETLRRLQDAEVAVEIRLISIAEGFFERMGVDFNINIKTDHNTQRYEPLITSGQFKPAGFINDFSPSNLVTGLTPAGTFTSDLDIPISTSSFGMAIPPFGGFPNAPGANGGINLGLAFLSDIQVFLFMEAAQGDQRTNVMQAPKITLFNGQNAILSVNDQQSFATGASVQVSNGQPIFTPQFTQIPTGATINVQAVISADRRFVRMNFTQINLTNLASAVVPLMPVTIPVQQQLDGVGTINTVVFTQFVQQPVINDVSITTTVAVPDGGTVLLGGLKRLSEGRNEFGPPVLSKIPYLNRLFKNVGYGREVQNLMMMVTPRIIINEEEEVRQTGVEFGQRGGL